jgi:alpha-N-acetylglucosaminidase
MNSTRNAETRPPVEGRPRRTGSPERKRVEAASPLRSFWHTAAGVFVVVALVVTARGQQDAPDLEAARALIARVLPGHEQQFVCELVPPDAGRDVFEYEAGPNAPIILRGNSSGSLAVAFNQYLRREALLDFDWLAGGPLRPARDLPPPAAKVRRACAARERFFLNYCTYGYTMPWWDWAQWERFLDWMAMNGVNRPLLQTGQESVWLHVWQEYGMPPDEIRAYFSAPAHLPWHRMANLDGWGGPLPVSYIEGQEKLQRLILARARTLGMKAVLPAFAGHVPRALARLRPEAKVVPIKPGWSGMPAEYATYFLDPKDPLFAEIQARFLAEQACRYGTDHLYAADPFNEMVPPSWEPAYLASVADSIYRGMAAADSDARWYQMTWTFTYEKLQGKWTGERLTAMLHAVPAGRMVLLDYAAEEQEFHSLTGGAYGLPFIWNYLGNFGGNTHLSAPLQKCATLESSALRRPNCLGVGSTLEAMGVNPVIYELVLEQPWEDGSSVDLATWVANYADRRAERADPAVRAAWAGLVKNVLCDNSRRSGTYGSVFQGLPSLASWQGRAQNSRQDYAPEELVHALERLFQAAPESQNADGYQYDVVNFTRQTLCNLANGIHQRMQAAAARTQTRRQRHCREAHRRGARRRFPPPLPPRPRRRQPPGLSLRLRPRAKRCVIDPLPPCERALGQPAGLELRQQLRPSLPRRVPPPQRIPLLPGVDPLRLRRRSRRIGYHDHILPLRSSHNYEAPEETLTVKDHSHLTAFATPSGTFHPVILSEGVGCALVAQRGAASAPPTGCTPACESCIAPEHVDSSLRSE